MESCIELTAADGFTFPAFVARPRLSLRGAVIILQEIFGVNSHIRHVAQQYADAGYATFAPLLFHRVQHDVDLGYTPEEVARGIELKAQMEGNWRDAAISDVQATVGHARQFGSVGLIGYCWGGLLAWRSASEVSGLTATVTYYGGGMTTGEELSRRPKVPVMAHFGENDHQIPLETVSAFHAKHPEVDVHIYEAGHGFNRQGTPAWNASAAGMAQGRTLGFLAQHFSA